MSRPHLRLGILPDDLYIKPEPWPRMGSPPKHGLETSTVMDGSPDPVSITDGERDAWFSDLFCELFGPHQ